MEDVYKRQEVDGRDVTFQTYALPGANGGETNYVRLRDIASVLNGTNAQFAVDWEMCIRDRPWAQSVRRRRSCFCSQAF